VKERAALAVSYIFMPTTFAMVAFILLAFCTPQGTYGLLVAFIAVLFGAVAPFLYLYLLLRKEKVTRIDVPIRQQRTIPYLNSSAIYFAGFVLLLLAKASAPVCALMFCYATNTLVISLINTQWKISAHAMGAAGPLTLLAIAFGPYVLPAFPIIAVVAWARVELKAHSTAQVVAGSVLGIVLTAAQTEAFLKLAGGH
jgi:membrane-associated phospholipid phosphatase